MRKLFLCALGALTLASLGCTDNPFPYSYSADHDVFYITPGEYRSVPINFTPDTNTLSKCASCDDYRRSLLDAAARNFADNRFSYNYYHSPDTGKSWGFADDVAYAEVPSASTPPEYTTTNTQEAGIDEMDLTKINPTVKKVAVYGYPVGDVELKVRSGGELTVPEIAEIQTEAYGKIFILKEAITPEAIRFESKAERIELYEIEVF